MPTNSTRSIKHDIISRDSSRIFAAVTIAVFVVVFSLFSFKTLLEESSFNGRVIEAKEAALEDISLSKNNAEELRTAFEAFSEQPQNAIGGSPTGDGPKDGTNPELVLDALPGEYDFPALSSSIEKLLKEGDYTIGSIGGSDNSLGGSSGASNISFEAEQIPYTFSLSADAENSETLLKTLESSIRPFYVQRVSLQGTRDNLTTSITLTTFFSPAKEFNLRSKVVN